MSEQESKKQILKSTGILGSVQVVNILIGIIRVKALAVLLGPIGVGITGIYQTTINLISSATGLGLNYSGVREISGAVASNEELEIAKKAYVLRIWSLFTGIAGMLFSLLFCKQLSYLAFGNFEYSKDIAFLSISLLVLSVTGSLNAFLQGMRRITDLAKANLLGALLGLIGTVITYLIFDAQGIVPALLITFIIPCLISWYYARKIQIVKVKVSIKECFHSGQAMAKLGFFMVVAALFGNGALYIVRAFIVNKAGLVAVGHFIAAWTITSMYTSAIFNAMGADYFPRLSAIQDDNESVNKLVNEQTEVALLLITPIIVAMLSFVNLVVELFYSSDFSSTAEILNWQLLGDVLKVLGWPLGYVLMAKAKGRLLIMTELVWNFSFLGLVYFGWPHFGINISGIAFLIAYIFNIVAVLYTVRRLTGFKWSKNVIRYISFFTPLLLISFFNQYLLNNWPQYFLGVALTTITSIYSVFHLKRIINLQLFIQKIRNKVSLNKKWL